MKHLIVLLFILPIGCGENCDNKPATQVDAAQASSDAAQTVVDVALADAEVIQPDAAVEVVDASPVVDAHVIDAHVVDSVDAAQQVDAAIDSGVELDAAN